MTTSDRRVSDPERIFLGPTCEEHTPEGRLWCEDPIDCDDCGEKAVEYIRADIANATITRLTAERDEAIAKAATLDSLRRSTKALHESEKSEWDAHVASLEAQLEKKRGK